MEVDRMATAIQINTVRDAHAVRSVIGQLFGRL